MDNKPQDPPVCQNIHQINEDIYFLLSDFIRRKIKGETEGATMVTARLFPFAASPFTSPRSKQTTGSSIHSCSLTGRAFFFFCNYAAS